MYARPFCELYGFLYDIQNGNRRDFFQLIEKIMRRIAGNRDKVGARMGELQNVLFHDGERRLVAFSQNEVAAVRDSRAADENDVDVILVPQRRGMLGDHLIEIYACGGAEPPQYAECFCHMTPPRRMAAPYLNEAVSGAAG